MAESLLVRKGGGGGLEVDGVEKTVVVESGFEVKKGELLEALIEGYTLPSTSNYLAISGEANNVFMDSFMDKIDDNKYIVAIQKSTTSLDLYLMTKNENDEPEKTFLGNTTLVSGNSQMTLYLHILNLSNNVFVLAYNTTAAGNHMHYRAIKLNNDNTLTFGATFSFGFINSSQNRGFTIGKTKRDSFIMIHAQDLAGTIRNTVTHCTVNLSNLTYSLQSQSTTGQLISTYRNEKIQGFTPNSTKFLTGFNFIFNFTAVASGARTDMWYFNGNYDSDTNPTSFSANSLNDVSMASYNGGWADHQSAKYNNGRYRQLSVVQTASATVSLVEVVYYSSSLFTLWLNFTDTIVGDLSLVNDKNMAFVGVRDSTTTSLSFKLFEMPKGNIARAQGAPKYFQDTTFTTYARARNSISLVPFNDGTFHLITTETTPSGHRVIVRAIKPVVKVIKANKLEYPINVKGYYGIALEDKNSGQNVKVLAF